MTNIDILRTELQDQQYQNLVLAQNYPAIAAGLNQKPLINNPVPQQQIPRQLTLVDLFQSITPGEALDTFKVPGLLNRIELVINNNDRVNIAILFEIVKTFISQTSKTNLESLLSQTELDPNWQAQIFGTSRAEELSIYPVNEMQIQSALN